MLRSLILLCFCLFTDMSLACTHFRLVAKDNSVVVGRSMEFGPNLETEIYTVNRRTVFKSKGPDGNPGMQWQAKYGYLALNGFRLFPVSGMNETGLSFDLLYFPGFAQYETYDANRASHAIPYYQMADYLLGNFSTVSEIKKTLPKVNVYAKPLEHVGQSVVFPVHYVLTDRSGQSIVIEYVEGRLHIYDEKVGVFTNSPAYPWQTTNLRNYMNLSAYAPKPIVKDGITYAATGQGGGALGLPGDYTPPSRFVRTAYLVNTAKPMDNALKTVNLAAHILNNVDIPYGTVRGARGAQVPDDMDFTQWIVIKDLTHKMLYFRSYDDLTLQKIDMNQIQLNPDSPPSKMVLVDEESHMIDATERFLRK